VHHFKTKHILSIFIARIGHAVRDIDCFFPNIEAFIGTLQEVLKSPRSRWCTRPHATSEPDSQDLQLASGPWKERDVHARTVDISIPNPCTSFEQLTQPGCLSEDGRTIVAGGTGWQLHLVHWSEDKKLTRESLAMEEEEDFDTPIVLKQSHQASMSPSKPPRNKKTTRPKSLQAPAPKNKKIKQEEDTWPKTPPVKKERGEQVNIDWLNYPGM
jgi:hypothetical protein